MENQEEAYHKFEKYNADGKAKDKKSLSKMGYSTISSDTGNALLSPLYSGDMTDDLIKAYENKIKKLNGPYRKCDSNELFIFCHSPLLDMDDNETLTFIENMYTENEKFPFSFDVVYIWVARRDKKFIWRIDRKNCVKEEKDITFLYNEGYKKRFERFIDGVE